MRLQRRGLLRTLLEIFENELINEPNILGMDKEIKIKIETEIRQTLIIGNEHRVCELVEKILLIVDQYYKNEAIIPPALKG